MEHSVAQFKQPVLPEIVESNVQTQVFALCAQAIQANAKIGKVERWRQRLGLAVAAFLCRHKFGGATAQFFGSCEVGIAPGTAFCLIAKLFQGIGFKFSCLAVVRFGKDHMVEHLGHPTVLTFGKVFFGTGQNGLRAAHIGQIFFSCGFRGKLVEMGGIGVIPAKVEIVDGLDIVVQAAIIAAQGEGL